MSTDADSGVPDADPDPVASESPDVLLAHLRATLERMTGLSPESFGQADQLDGIAELEAVGNAVKAVQSEWIVVFARGHVEQQIRRGVTDPG